MHPTAQRVDLAPAPAERHPSRGPGRRVGPRRILFLAPQPFFCLRGTPIAERALLRVLSERGYHVDVLTYHEGSDVEIPNCRILRTVSLPGVRGIPPGFSWKKVACDVVLLGKALRLARRERYDMVHAVEEAGFMAALLQRLFGLPFVYDMDSRQSEQILEAYPFLFPFRSAMESAERFVIRRAFAVLAVCRALEELAREASPEVLIGRIEDVSLIDGGQEGADRLRDLVGGGEAPIALYVGNLEPYQGVDLMLRGFASAIASGAAVELAIVGGSAAHREEYAGLASELGIADHVHLLGPRPLEHLGWYLRQADMLVSPRTGGTNTPMKIFSYLDSGTPVLATRLLTHTQVLDDEISMLVDPDPESFGDGVARLLRDPELQQNLGMAARHRVQGEFTEEAFRRKVHCFYDAIEKKLERARPDVEAMPEPA